jgi:hypothetical protein
MLIGVMDRLRPRQPCNRCILAASNVRCVGSRRHLSPRRGSHGGFLLVFLHETWLAGLRDAFDIGNRQEKL